MKKILALFMAISLIFAFSACSASEDEDTAATQITDESTSDSTQDSEETLDEESTESAESETDENTDEDTDEETSTAEKTTTEKSTAKETTTEETTTQKAKKRDVSVKIVLPYYNDQKTKLRVRYRADGDKEYTKLEFEDSADSKKKVSYDTVTLDGSTVKEYDLGKLKGDVTVRISMSGLEITGDVIVIPASESSGTMNPATGIEMLEGVDD